MALNRDFLNHLVRLARDVDRVNKDRTLQQEKEFQDLNRAYRVYDIEQDDFPADIKNLRVRFKGHVLKNLLRYTLQIDDYISFDSLKLRPAIPEFTYPVPVRSLFIPPKPLNYEWLSEAEKRDYQKALEVAELKYQAHVNVYMQEQREYKQKLNLLLAQTREQQQVIDRFQDDFEQSDAESIINYFHIVLMASTYPNGFPQHAKLGYITEDKQLIVEYDLPTLDIVPLNKSYRDNRIGKGTTSTKFSESERRLMYTSVIAQITLRTIHELFESDRIEHLQSIVFNGYVEAIDPANGHPKRGCVVTIEAKRDVFLGLNLGQVDPVTCLKGLGGILSEKIDEFMPITPIRDFETLNAHLIEETDHLSELDSRLDLLALTNAQFKDVILDLFGKMGLEITQVADEQDGNFHCVALDPRPVLGGSVVIHINRRADLVGVSALEDLHGQVQHEGAYKGILLTTATYDHQSAQFAQGKPLELLNGTNLVYLLKEYGGIDAKIVPSDDWVDEV